MYLGLNYASSQTVQSLRWNFSPSSSQATLNNLMSRKSEELKPRQNYLTTAWWISPRFLQCRVDAKPGWHAVLQVTWSLREGEVSCPGHLRSFSSIFSHPQALNKLLGNRRWKRQPCQACPVCSHLRAEAFLLTQLTQSI